MQNIRDLEEVGDSAAHSGKSTASNFST